jgi:hypothetical protein
VLHQSGFETISTRPSAVTFSIRHALARAAQHRGVAGQLASRMSGLPLMSRLRIRFRIGEMQVVARPSPPSEHQSL